MLDDLKTLRDEVWKARQNVVAAEADECIELAIDLDAWAARLSSFIERYEKERAAIAKVTDEMSKMIGTARATFDPKVSIAVVARWFVALTERAKP